MQSALYVGLSAQVALEKRLQTIANNVANVNTAAFRTDVVKFETVLSKAGANPVAFSSPATTSFRASQAISPRAATRSTSPWSDRALSPSPARTARFTPATAASRSPPTARSEEHTSELQSRGQHVCRL